MANKCDCGGRECGNECAKGCASLSPAAEARGCKPSGGYVAGHYPTCGTHKDKLGANQILEVCTLRASRDSLLERVERMAEALKTISGMPCIHELLGEDNDDCGCASCLSKSALALRPAGSGEGQAK